MIVVDTNIIGYLYLKNLHSERVEKLLKKDPNWIAPQLWKSELRNVLVQYLRQNLLPLEDTLNIMEEAEWLMQDRTYEVPSWKVLEIAKACKCSAYDCEFVVLAKEFGVPLVTVDQKILKEFSYVAVALTEFIG